MLDEPWRRGEAIPQEFKVLAHTQNSFSLTWEPTKGFYGLQFHPEVVHTEKGIEILRIFLRKLAKQGQNGAWRAL